MPVSKLDYRKKFQNNLYYEVHEKVPVNISQMSSELISPGTGIEKAELMPFRNEMCLEKSEDGQGSLAFGQEWDGDGLWQNLNPRARHRAGWWREDKARVSQQLHSQRLRRAEADVPQGAGTPQGKGLHQEVEENGP